jgi:hypothetical protein
MITGKTHVAELLAKHPELRAVLIREGLTGLRDPQHQPPPFVTLAFAAQRHGIPARPLVTALNHALQEKPTMGIIKSIKKKIQQHHEGCCHCGGTPTEQAKPVVSEPARRAKATQKKKS